MISARFGNWDSAYNRPPEQPAPSLDIIRFRFYCAHSGAIPCDAFNELPQEIINSSGGVTITQKGKIPALAIKIGMGHHQKL